MSDFNLTQYVLAAGRQTPKKVALELAGPNGQQVWTYAELTQAVLGTARGLLNSGLIEGDRVLLRLGNEVGFPIGYLGAIAAGIIPVPTPAALTKPEVEKIAATLRPSACLCSGGLVAPDNVPKIDAETLTSFRNLAPLDPVMGDENRPAYIIPTSGTSGKPRLVVHAHRAIKARRFMWNDWYGLNTNDRMMHAGAFNWTYTLGTGLLDPWSIGATAVIPEAGMNPSDIPPLMRGRRATIFAAAPGVYRQMLRAEGLSNLKDLRHGLTAGEKCPESLRAQWRDTTGTELHEAFGQSEISTFISSSPNRPAPAGTLGYPQSGRRIGIVDPDGNEVAAGVPGIIAVDRDDPGLMLGIWGDDDGTQSRIKGQWYLTGDSGSHANDGAIHYLGRDDDMLNAGGFRVSPLEVEAAVASHPQVQEAAAVDYEVREDVKVIAVFYTSDHPIDQSDLTSHSSRQLAPHKCPRKFIRIDAMPRNPNGKLLRRTLRQAYGQSHDQA